MSASRKGKPFRAAADIFAAYGEAWRRFQRDEISATEFDHFVVRLLAESLEARDNLRFGAIKADPHTGQQEAT